MNWFYYDENGEKQGPVSGTIIKALAKSGLITRHTKIENENGRVALAKQVRGIVFMEPVASPPGLRKDEIVSQPTNSGEIYGVSEASPFAFESDTVEPRATGTQTFLPRAKNETESAAFSTPEEPLPTTTNLALAESSVTDAEENRSDETKSKNAPTGPNPFTLAMSEEVSAPNDEPNPFTTTSGVNSFAVTELQASEYVMSKTPLRSKMLNPPPNRVDILKRKIEQIAEKVKPILGKIAAIPPEKKKKILLCVGIGVAALMIGVFIVPVLVHVLAGIFSGGSGDNVTEFDKKLAARKIVDFASFNENLIVTGRLAEADVIHFRKEIYWPALCKLRPIKNRTLSDSIKEGPYHNTLMLGFQLLNYDTVKRQIKGEDGLNEMMAQYSDDLSYSLRKKIENLAVESKALLKEMSNNEFRHYYGQTLMSFDASVGQGLIYHDLTLNQWKMLDDQGCIFSLSGKSLPSSINKEEESYSNGGYVPFEERFDRLLREAKDETEY